MALVDADPLLPWSGEIALVLAIWDRRVPDQGFMPEPWGEPHHPPKLLAAPSLCAGGVPELMVQRRECLPGGRLYARDRLAPRHRNLRGERAEGGGTPQSVVKRVPCLAPPITDIPHKVVHSAESGRG